MFVMEFMYLMIHRGENIKPIETSASEMVVSFSTVSKIISSNPVVDICNQGFSSNFGKGQWPKLGKMIDLTSKLREFTNIEYNKCSKIYPQNQVILDCIMSSIPLKHTCLSIILIWAIESHK